MLCWGALFKQAETKRASIASLTLKEHHDAYFDALGRNVRKKMNLVKLYNLDFGLVVAQQTSNVISGHTDADINIDWCVSNKEKKDEKVTYTIDVTMSTKITNNFTSTNAKLQAHEDKHKEIYMNPVLASGSWNGINVDIPKGKRKKQKCKLIVDSFWESESNAVAVKWKIQSLLNAHNNWDYQDPNNEGHHMSFPDVEKTLDSLYNVQLQKCNLK